MIPTFPNFKKLEFSDREEIQYFTKNYLPYSDFNFTSMWSWDVNNEFEVSYLHNNLVVKFVDYITEQYFFSFLGLHKPTETARQLLEFAKEKKINPQLRLIPEEIASLLDRKNFKITDDRDGYDYILGSEKMSLYNGKKLRGKRNFINRFNKSYQIDIVNLDLSNAEVKSQIEDLYKIWATGKESEQEWKREYEAIRRLLSSPSFEHLIAVGIYLGGELIGFIINEDLKNDYAMLHFEKAQYNSYVGIYPRLMQAGAKILTENGCKFINYEQDLGIEGLRKAKSEYSPVQYLKKITVELYTG